MATKKTTGENITWSQPTNPPPQLFFGRKEKDYVKQINDEIIERVIGQTIGYYAISQKHTNYHELYGEAIYKTFLPPVRVHALVSWEGSTTTTTNYGIDNDASIIIKFHKRRLTEDQDLFAREGDIVCYGDRFYEIVKLEEPRELFGQNLERFEIQAKAIRARRSLFLFQEPGALLRIRQREKEIIQHHRAIKPTSTTIINNISNNDITTNIDLFFSGSDSNSPLTLCPETGSVDVIALKTFADSPEKFAGKIIYVTKPSASVEVLVTPFDETGKFYFNENGAWFASPFVVFPDTGYVDECVSSVSGNIINISADDTSPDFPTLLDLISSSVDYIGDIVYITETGSVIYLPFDEEQKYYFNETGTWFKSPFV